MTERDELRESLRREEAARDEKLRFEQEKMYAEAKLQMERELLTEAAKSSCHPNYFPFTTTATNNNNSGHNLNCQCPSCFSTPPMPS